MAQYNFKKDFIVGKFGEYCWLKILESKGSIFKEMSDNNEYDILVNTKGKDVTHEVKTDVFCYLPYETYHPIEKRNVVVDGKDSGNIFIEKSSYNREAGISVCKADWFVYYYPYLGQIWLIKTDKLKKLVGHKTKFELKKYSGDSGSNTEGWVIPREENRKHFKVINVKPLPSGDKEIVKVMRGWLAGDGGKWLRENDNNWWCKFGVPYLKSFK